MKTAVILVSYNQQDYIVDSLDGILSQSREPDEVIIADDCSTDKTQFLILEYIKCHNLRDKWTLLFNPKNLGINGNLQNAVNHTTADIIIPMAGDDISLNNRCAYIINLFKEHPHLSIVTTSLYKINAEGKIIGKKCYRDELYSDIETSIKKGMANVFPVGQAWRRNLFVRFGDLSMAVPNEDDQITFWGLLTGGIYCSKQITIKYRIHSHSASSWLRKGLSDDEFLSRFILDMPIRRVHMELWQQFLSKVNVYNKDELLYLLKLKIEVYTFMEHLMTESFFSRCSFLRKHLTVLNVRESVYLLGGKYGILCWRWARSFFLENKI